MPTEALWVRHHHERFDGRGYPDQLTGETIPLESRIIFVADSLEAMTSHRPYRQAPGQEFAIDELNRHAGTQFDPHVVDALCQALEPSPTNANRQPQADNRSHNQAMSGPGAPSTTLAGSVRGIV